MAPATWFPDVATAFHDVDEARDQFTLWITTAHEGTGGSVWARRCPAAGRSRTSWGPGAKIVPRYRRPTGTCFMGDIHLPRFGLPNGPRSVEAAWEGRLSSSRTDQCDDALTTTFRLRHRRPPAFFVDRWVAPRMTPPGLLKRPSRRSPFPPDRGHAYLFGEFHVMKAIRSGATRSGSRTTSRFSVKRRFFGASGRK